MKKNSSQNKWISINPKRQPLTPDKLRELSGLDVTDEKANEIIHSIRLFCKVLYSLAVSRNKEGYIEDKQDDYEPKSKAA